MNVSNNLADYNSQNQLIQTNAPGITAFPTYDAAGDITADGRNQYLYDAEGRICATAGGISIFGGSTMTGYLYNAAGERVAKGTISSWSCDPTTNGFSMTNQYLLGPNGEQMTEMTVAGTTETWLHTNIYAGGSLIATYENDNSGPHFRLTDWLGTMRAQTNYAGVLEQTCTSLPFGDGPACSSATEQFFTGKERDAESGLDYFGARYYASNMGRWMSPDWSEASDPVPYGRFGYPQSLNLYTYAMNNPLISIDVDGHDGCSIEGMETNCSSLTESAARENADEAQQQAAKQPNSRQKWEAENEKKTKEIIDSYPAAPASARLTLTKCENKSCDYTLSGVIGTFYVYEHFANDRVAGAKPAGHGDFTTSLTGLAGGYTLDQITAFGVGTLDQHRFFTISSSGTYDPNKQMSVMIFEAGQNVSFEHLYDAAPNAPSYINYIPTASYHP